MQGKNKVAVEARKTAMKARGQFRYDNMDAAEKAAYVAKHGAKPAYDLKAADKSNAAIRRWAAQAEGQRAYVPAVR